MVLSQDGWHDDSDEESWWEDAEDAEAADPDDQVEEVVPCPHCGLDIFEDAEQCPHCGDYVVHHSSNWDGRPIWWIVIGLLGVLATLFALIWSG